MPTNEFLERIKRADTGTRNSEHVNELFSGIFADIKESGYQARMSVNFVHTTKGPGVNWVYLPTINILSVLARADCNGQLLNEDIEVPVPFNRDSTSHPLVGLALTILDTKEFPITRFDVLPTDSQLVTSIYVARVALADHISVK